VFVKLASHEESPLWVKWRKGSRSDLMAGGSLGGRSRRVTQRRIRQNPSR
jgi:hypothetical protein